MSKRASGKTFRRLLTALAKASAGDSVFYLTDKAQLCSWYYDRARDLVAAYTGMNRIAANKAHRTIEFPGGGKIRFLVNNERNSEHFLGIKNAAYEFDD